MGFLSSLIGGDYQLTALEKFLDGTTQSSMGQRIATLDDSLKVPYAVTMAVLLKSRFASKSLMERAERMHKRFRFTGAVRHDPLFVELAAFHYFVLMQDYVDAEDPEGAQADAPWSYSRTLRTSLALANSFVLKHCKGEIGENLVIVRSVGYASIGDGTVQSGAAALTGFLGKALDEHAAADPDLNAELAGYLATIPFDEIRAVCRGIYDARPAR